MAFLTSASSLHNREVHFKCYSLHGRLAESGQVPIASLNLTSVDQFGKSHGVPGSDSCATRGNPDVLGRDLSESIRLIRILAAYEYVRLVELSLTVKVDTR